MVPKPKPAMEATPKPRTMAMVPLVSSSQPSLGSERVTRKDSAFSKRSSSMILTENLASLWSAW